MASFKVKFKKGIIYIQIIHKRKVKLFKVYSCDEEDFNLETLEVKKSNPNYRKINKLIHDKINDLKSRELDLELIGEPYSIDDLINKTPQSKLSDVIEDYYQFVKREGKFSAARKYLNIKNHIESFNDINASTINVRYIRDFLQYLNLEGVSPNTAEKYFKMLKTSLRYSGTLPYKVDNFKPKRTPIKHTTITKEEFKEIEKKKLSGWEDLARDSFLLQIYTWGTRISSTLSIKWTDIKKGMIYIFESKTGREKVVPINNDIQRILDKYKDQSYYVLPILTQINSTKERFQKHIESKTSIINKHHKVIAAKCGIDKRLTSHVARYSFVTWLDESGTHLRDRKYMLNHSSERMTEHYSSAKPNLKNLDKIYRDLFNP